jgi:BarA-like signal transduction histidine kinase
MTVSLKWITNIEETTVKLKNLDVELIHTNVSTAHYLGDVTMLLKFLKPFLNLTDLVMMPFPSLNGTTDKMSISTCLLKPVTKMVI